MCQQKPTEDHLQPLADILVETDDLFQHNYKVKLQNLSSLNMCHIDLSLL